MLAPVAIIPPLNPDFVPYTAAKWAQRSTRQPNPALRHSSTTSRHLSIMSSVTGKTRLSNMGHMVLVSQLFNSSRRALPSIKTSMPKPSSANVTALA